MRESESKAPARLIIESVERVLEEGRLAALVTLVEAPTGVGSKLLVESSVKRIGSLGDSRLDEVMAGHVAKFLESREEARTLDVKELAAELSQWQGARLLFERIQPELRLVICGAGHVGASLARLASFIGYRATIIDDRAEFVTRDRFPDERIELIAANSWTEAVRKVVGNGHGVAVAVVTRGHNEDEVGDFAAFAREHDVKMRFIEFMPLDSGHDWSRADVVSGREIREHINERFPLVHVEIERGSETSSRYRFADGAPGEIGIIAPVTEPFCGACSRIRLTADGQIRTCLFSTIEYSLRDVIRSAATRSEIVDYIESVVLKKEPRHYINDPGFVAPSRTMSFIGG